MTRLFATTAALALLAAPAMAQPTNQQAAPPMEHSGMDRPDMDHSQMDHSQMDHSKMDMGEMDEMPGMTHAGHAMSQGALGSYAMTREASGTSWQPDASTHEGLHLMYGPWMVMAHATIDGVYSWQDGPRGDDKGFVSGMIMSSARREIGDHGTLQFRAMLSPDPFMGKRGYPELLATGETADGVTPLVDRQHPHDLFMELSGAYAYRLTEKDSVFLYAGLPGEPAFGPPAFMHRASIMDSPEAPISHHWLDSTHIVFGVVTAGYVHDNWKVEASRFRGREPDEHRFDIEHATLDSTALRLSYNPTANWSLQASWADVKSPEQLDPDTDVRKWSASAIYTVPFGADGWWSTTAAWGRRSAEHQDLDAFALESAVRLNPAWTVFGRAERIDTDELVFTGGHHGPTFTVGKVSLGAVRDFPVSEHVSVGLGGLYAVNFVPGELKALYGRSEPGGAMGFVRLKLH
ncbi:hypothetical protein [Phenylobacterium soli]|uniref:TonB-dependent receptor n=1 Tax=Phenylobacterium soli TaxID=2170551 RepID=A0A328AGK7_9CAUL|nr:hypothetical protein [Phenylobacterium soli]RAK53993.1 hypothetical protein DJ017_05385 [Phenylobacterium soli]